MGEMQTPPPGWLVAAVDQRMQLVLELLPGYKLMGVGAVLTSLTEPAEGATEKERKDWERQCDNCKRVFADDEDFWTGSCSREAEGVHISITYGVCAECKELP